MTEGIRSIQDNPTKISFIRDRQTNSNGDRPSTTNQFPNAIEVKIFESVDRYYGASPKNPPS